MADGLVWAGVPGSALGSNPSSAAPAWVPHTLTHTGQAAAIHGVAATPACPRGVMEQYSGVQLHWAWECFGQEPVCNYRALQGAAWRWRSRVLSQEYLLSESREEMALLLCCCCLSSLRLSDLILEKSAGNPCSSTHLSGKHLQRDKACLVPWSQQSSRRSWSPRTHKTPSAWRDAGDPQLSLLSAPSGLSQHHHGEPGASCTAGATPGKHSWALLWQTTA